MIPKAFSQVFSCSRLYSQPVDNILDLATRAELPRPVSKALHRNDWHGHFLTLALATAGAKAITG